MFTSMFQINVIFRHDIESDYSILNENELGNVRVQIIVELRL